MDYPILKDDELDDGETTPERDIRAMLSMIDYLIARIGQIDEMSTTCLIMARMALATFPAHPRPQ